MSTYTDNVHLAKPAEGDTNWAGEVNGNFDTIDELYPVGFAKGCRLLYEDASNITVTEGAIDIYHPTEDKKRRMHVLNSDLTGINFASNLDTGSEQANTWYYVYAVRRTSGDNVLTSSDIKISATAPSRPTYDGAKYHPTNTSWRFLGSFYNDGSGNIKEFYRYEGKVWWNDIVTVLFSGNATTWTVVNCATAVPQTALYAWFECVGTITNANANLLIRQNGSTSALGHAGEGLYNYGNAIGPCPVDSSQRVQYLVSTAACTATLLIRGYEESI